MNFVNADSEENPSFLELLDAVREVVKTEYREMFNEQKRSHTIFAESSILPKDVLYVAVGTIILATLRHFATEYVFKPIGRRYCLSQSSQEKLPESAWRFLYFLCSWSYSCYLLLLSGKYKYFQQPSTTMKNWNINEYPPNDIYFLYVLQTSFYIHFSFTTLFVDTWRKDSIAMFTHHIVTLVLVIVSHSYRYHKIATIIFFLLDMSDALMEFAKINIYFTMQGKNKVRRHEILANVTFSCFVIIWFVGRLYWYPVKVLYAAAYHSAGLDLPHRFLMNFLLWIILFLQYYWTIFILRVLYGVITGDGSPKDCRDFEDKDTNTSRLSSGNNVEIDGSHGDSPKKLS